VARTSILFSLFQSIPTPFPLFTVRTLKKKGTGHDRCLPLSLPRASASLLLFRYPKKSQRAETLHFFFFSMRCLDHFPLFPFPSKCFEWMMMKKPGCYFLPFLQDICMVHPFSPSSPAGSSPLVGKVVETATSFPSFLLSVVRGVTRSPSPFFPPAIEGAGPPLLATHQSRLSLPPFPVLVVKWHEGGRMDREHFFSPFLKPARTSLSPFSLIHLRDIGEESGCWRAFPLPGTDRPSPSSFSLPEKERE